MVSLDTDPPLDEPEHFLEAATEFLLLCQPTTLLAGPIRDATTEHVADTLACLAWRGHIVSAAHHDRVCADYAARLRHCEDAANELVRQLHGEHQ